MSNTAAKRKPQRLNVPSLEEDPAERKRLLNVLAQRRYRQRKKEQIRRLEQSVQLQSNRSTDNDGIRTPCSTADAMVDRYSTTWSEEGFPKAFDQRHSLDPTAAFEQTWEPSQDSQVTNSMDDVCLNSATLEAFEASFSFPLPSLPSSPSISNTTISSSNSLLHSPQTRTEFIGADEGYLPVLELNLLRGAMAIAKRLGVDSLIWSLDSVSPFCDPNASFCSYDHLPANLKPTTVQLSNRHHPVLDVLPWPAVRDKLIMVFTLPIDSRPSSAQTPTALINLVYDMEDSAEGIRIWGDDPYADTNWEIGQKLFQNWWWALNSQVVNRSNEMRRTRGATILGSDRVAEVD